MNQRSLTGLALVCVAVAACRPAATTRPAPTATPARISVIPAPVSLTTASGAPFALDSSTQIVVEAGNDSAVMVGEALAALLRPATGLPLSVVRGSDARPSSAVVLRLNSSRSDVGD